MAKPTEGFYYLICAKDSSYCIDVAKGSIANGANVQIHRSNLTYAQSFFVKPLKSGLFKITSRLSGKALDAGTNPASDTNVVMYNTASGRKQTWALTEDSSTKVTVDGVQYNSFKIAVSSSTGLALDVAGGEMGDNVNVRVHTSNNTSAQRWAFVPIPAFVDGGIYEIHSMLDKKMALDVTDGSYVNGTNIQLYDSSTPSNNRRFKVQSTSGGWTIQNIKTADYIRLAKSTLADGVNVVSHGTNDTLSKWRIDTIDEISYKNKTCKVVYIGAKNDTGYLLDANRGKSKKSGTNVQVWSRQEDTAQRWIMYPTEAYNTIPTPSALGFADTYEKAIASAGRATVFGPQGTSGAIQEVYFPMWKCADAVDIKKANSYQWRYCSRFLRSNGTWTGWKPTFPVQTTFDNSEKTGMTGWKTVNACLNSKTNQVVSVDDLDENPKESLDVAFNLSKYKAAQFQYEVRCCGVTEAKVALYGPSKKVTGTFYYRPTTSIASASWTPEGIRLVFDNDYDQGLTYIHVNSVRWGGKEHFVSGEIVDTIDQEDGSYIIPQSSLSGVPANNQQITVKYRNGNDMRQKWNPVFEQQVNVAYSVGTMPATTFTRVDLFTLDVTVSHGANGYSNAYVVVDDSVVECSVIQSGSSTKFRVPFPFGADYTLIVCGENANGSYFLTQYSRHETGRAAHAWMLFDGTVYSLEFKENEVLSTEYTLDAKYSALQLNARPYESVGMAVTRSAQFSADGVLVPGVSQSTPEDIEYLVGKHCIYRSPHGDVAYVGVTSASRTEDYQKTKMSVKMTRETV